MQDAESPSYCTLLTHIMIYLASISRLYNSLEQVRHKGRSALKPTAGASGSVIRQTRRQ